MLEGYLTRLSLKHKIVLIVVTAIVATATILVFTSPAWSLGFGRFVRSDRVKTDVTIAVVGLSTFITGFGMRDVIGRWYNYRSRRSVPSGKRP